MDRNCVEYYTGCLLGGACGDALGWPVEFDSFEDIQKQFGRNGITEMIPNESGFFEITDDTQMTLFTAEGLLRAWTSARHLGGTPDFQGAVRSSYLAWLETQGESGSVTETGWLSNIEGLKRRRAPGNTCISALRDGSLSEFNIAMNSSKGCGGVMRAAPAGLLAARINKDDPVCSARLAFELGCSAAALTHGHPSGYFPAGVFAAIIATIVRGGDIFKGIENSLNFLKGRLGSLETINAINNAVQLWEDRTKPPSPATVESLGGGWVGEEALSISIYCALAAGNDLKLGVTLAVNHSGDSDSTGSITGNILGTLLGHDSIPSYWTKDLELNGVIQQIGEDLYTAFEGSQRWLLDYPQTC